MIIFFDLEGPLSPQDNAYEVMKLIGDEGARIFEAISKYDDILALEGREGYEPGDTLALIIPFLMLHGITEEDIKRVSERATLVRGAKYLFERLRAEGWDIYIISTSYEQHAYNIGRRLGLEPSRIICTALTLNQDWMSGKEKESLLSLTKRVEERIIELHSNSHSQINELRSVMDEFFFHQLPRYGFDVLRQVRVIGGERKAEAIWGIMEEKGKPLSDAIAVGDSITDYKMLKLIKEHGGLSVVFNGNEYAVPYATVGLASVDISFLLILCDAFVQGGKARVKEIVKTWEANRVDFESNPDAVAGDYIRDDIKDSIKIKSRKLPLPYLHDIEDADDSELETIIRVHKRVRMEVRARAGRLG